jgi:hypothetical protein
MHGHRGAAAKFVMHLNVDRALAICGLGGDEPALVGVGSTPGGETQAGVGSACRAAIGW